jgi:hypothetical protein
MNLSINFYIARRTIVMKVRVLKRCTWKTKPLCQILIHRSLIQCLYLKYSFYIRIYTLPLLVTSTKVTFINIARIVNIREAEISTLCPPIAFPETPRCFPQALTATETLAVRLFFPVAYTQSSHPTIRPYILIALRYDL